METAEESDVGNPDLARDALGHSQADSHSFADIMDVLGQWRTESLALTAELACDPVDAPSRSHWPLDGSGVVVEDLGPSGFDGSAVAIASVPDGPMGNALEWNGTNSNVIISDAGENDGQSPATLALWLRPDVVDVAQVVAARRMADGPGRGWELGITSAGRLSVRLVHDLDLATTPPGLDLLQVQTTQTLDAGQWVHVAVTWTPGVDAQLRAEDITIYVDGEMWPSSTVHDTLSGSIFAGANVPMSLGAIVAEQSGALLTSPTAVLQGALDDVRWFDSALGQPQVNALRGHSLMHDVNNCGACGNTCIAGWACVEGTCAPPTCSRDIAGYWSFDEMDGYSTSGRRGDFHTGTRSAALRAQIPVALFPDPTGSGPWQQGHIGGALRFDDDPALQLQAAVSVTDAWDGYMDDNRRQAIAFWIKRDVDDGASFIVGRRQSGGQQRGWDVIIDEDGYLVWTRQHAPDNRLVLRTDAPVGTGDWLHVVLDGGMTSPWPQPPRFWVDGNQAAITIVEDTLNDSLFVSEPLRLGNNFAGSEPLNGAIDDLLFLSSTSAILGWYGAWYWNNSMVAGLYGREVDACLPSGRTECEVGYASCDSTMSTGCETQIGGDDSYNCGGCGVYCAGVCDNGECLADTQEKCHIPGDEDGNGLADCADQVACASQMGCAGPTENCYDMFDNDGNGLVDCLDATCSGYWPCVPGQEWPCNDGIDNDGNGLVDGADTVCSWQFGVLNFHTEICNDGADNDGVSGADCADPACQWTVYCYITEYYACGNDLDDDGDGLVDCLDPDCGSGQADCPTLYEGNCDDGVDGDSNMLVDCNDAACSWSPLCQSFEQGADCADGLDNDFNGLIDCDDAACVWQAHCPASESGCTDGVDNDGNGLTDCSDSDCTAACALLPARETACNDWLDNDGDGLLDCADNDCASAYNCDAQWLSEYLCADGISNDTDEAVDCDDVDCCYHLPCWEECGLPEPELLCDDDIDNDSDSLIDCDDWDCKYDPACALPTEFDCSNEQDDDGNGLTDCQDPACMNWGVCFVGTYEYDCFDAADNNGNGLIDCADPDCSSTGTCSSFEFACWDGIDNDRDGLIDCDDDECQSQGWYCPPESELDCTDMRDDDLDGRVDCGDSDCEEYSNCVRPEPPLGDSPAGGPCLTPSDCAWTGLGPFCLPEAASGQPGGWCGSWCDPGTAATCAVGERCLPSISGDGWQCTPTCLTSAECESGEVCRLLGSDEDSSYPVCSVPCTANIECPETGYCNLMNQRCATPPEDCSDVVGADEDGNGTANCDDEACWGTWCPYPQEWWCLDGFDNDDDSLVDCLDSDCETSNECTFEPEQCETTPGEVDCADWICERYHPACMVPGQFPEHLCAGGNCCVNSTDDDLDGFADCADPDCHGLFGCSSVGELICTNIDDDDDDELLDCFDPDCAADAACAPGSVLPGDTCNVHSDCSTPTISGVNLSPFCFSSDIGLTDESFCTHGCRLTESDCAAGYSCVDIGMNGTAGMCLPVCFDDAHCATEIHCADVDWWWGFCQPDCESHEDCEEEHACEPVSGQCIENYCVSAESSPDCVRPVETACDNMHDDDADGLPDCADSDCANEASCIQDENATEPGGPCSAANECAPFALGAMCLPEALTGRSGGVCAGWCDPLNPEPCGAGFTCAKLTDSVFHVCVDTCTSESECAPGELCRLAIQNKGGLEARICQSPCTSDSECPETGICNEASGRCGEEWQGCEPEHGQEVSCYDLKDDDCDSHPDCFDSDCVGAGACTIGATPIGSPCTSHADCTAVASGPAAVMPICLPPGVVSSDSACSHGCVLGENDCPIGSECMDVGFNSLIGACFAVCESDAECPADTLCQESFLPGLRTCRTTGCVTDAECDEFESCDAATNTCVYAGEDCSNGVDDDDNDLADCLDPTCAANDRCMALGTGELGDGCQYDVDCSATGIGPVCLEPFSVASAFGSCTEYCDPTAENPCAEGGECRQIADGRNVCVPTCMWQDDCSGGLCRWNRHLLSHVCSDACESDQDCDNGTCNQGSCVPFFAAEVCATPGDDDGDGLVNCDDEDCGDGAAPGECEGSGDPENCEGSGGCIQPEICTRGGSALGGGFGGFSSDCQGASPYECQSRTDEDGDGQFDCADVDCQDAIDDGSGLPICAQGSRETGEFCMSASDCSPVEGAIVDCLPAQGQSSAVFPTGVCTISCSLGDGNLCPSGFACHDVGAAGNGVCVDRCAGPGTCPGTGQCLTVLGGTMDVCVDGCRENANCETGNTCYTPPSISNGSGSNGNNSFTSGLTGYGECRVSCTTSSDCPALSECESSVCRPTRENCVDGVDNDADGLLDCLDEECAPLEVCTPTESGYLQNNNETVALGQPCSATIACVAPAVCHSTRAVCHVLEQSLSQTPNLWLQPGYVRLMENFSDLALFREVYGILPVIPPNSVKPHPDVPSHFEYAYGIAFRQLESVLEETFEGGEEITAELALTGQVNQQLAYAIEQQTMLGWQAVLTIAQILDSVQPIQGYSGFFVELSDLQSVVPGFELSDLPESYSSGLLFDPDVFLGWETFVEFQGTYTNRPIEEFFIIDDGIVVGFHEGILQVTSFEGAKQGYMFPPGLGIDVPGQVSQYHAMVVAGAGPSASDCPGGTLVCAGLGPPSPMPRTALEALREIMNGSRLDVDLLGRPSNWTATHLAPPAIATEGTWLHARFAADSDWEVEFFDSVTGRFGAIGKLYIENMGELGLLPAGSITAALDSGEYSHVSFLMSSDGGWGEACVCLSADSDAGYGYGDSWHDVLEPASGDICNAPNPQSEPCTAGMCDPSGNTYISTAMGEYGDFPFDAPLPPGAQEPDCMAMMVNPMGHSSGCGGAPTVDDIRQRRSFMDRVCELHPNACTDLQTRVCVNGGGEGGGEVCLVCDASGCYQVEGENSSDFANTEVDHQPINEYCEDTSISDCTAELARRLCESAPGCGDKPTGGPAPQPEDGNGRLAVTHEGDPVNLQTGHLEAPVIDFTVPGDGPFDLQMARFYNGANNSAGRVGYRWQSMLDERFVPVRPINFDDWDWAEAVGMDGVFGLPEYCFASLPTVNCILHIQPDGSRTTYFRLPSGSFVPEHGGTGLIGPGRRFHNRELGRVEYLEPSDTANRQRIEFTLVGADGLRTVFDQYGRIRRKVTTEGDALRYCYNDDGRPEFLVENAPCDNVAAARRYMRFEYGPLGLLMAASDHTGQHVEYDYELALAQPLGVIDAPQASDTINTTLNSAAGGVNVYSLLLVRNHLGVGLEDARAILEAGERFVVSPSLLDTGMQYMAPFDDVDPLNERSVRIYQSAHVVRSTLAHRHNVVLREARIFPRPTTVGSSEHQIGARYDYARPPALRVSNPIVFQMTRLAALSQMHAQSSFTICIPGPDDPTNRPAGGGATAARLIYQSELFGRLSRMERWVPQSECVLTGATNCTSNPWQLELRNIYGWLGHTGFPEGDLRVILQGVMTPVLVQSWGNEANLAALDTLVETTSVATLCDGATDIICALHPDALDAVAERPPTGVFSFQTDGVGLIPQSMLSLLNGYSFEVEPAGSGEGAYTFQAVTPYSPHVEIPFPRNPWAFSEGMATFTAANGDTVACHEAIFGTPGAEDLIEDDSHSISDSVIRQCWASLAQSTAPLVRDYIQLALEERAARSTELVKGVRTVDRAGLVRWKMFNRMGFPIADMLEHSGGWVVTFRTSTTLGLIAAEQTVFFPSGSGSPTRGPLTRYIYDEEFGASPSQQMSPVSTIVYPGDSIDGISSALPSALQQVLSSAIPADEPVVFHHISDAAFNQPVLSVYPNSTATVSIYGHMQQPEGSRFAVPASALDAPVMHCLHDEGLASVAGGRVTFAPVNDEYGGTHVPPDALIAQHLVRFTSVGGDDTCLIDTVWNTYDAEGRLILRENPDGSLTQWHYEDGRHPWSYTSVVVHDSNESPWPRAIRGLLPPLRTPFRVAEQRRLNAIGLLANVSAPDARVTTFEYDGYHRVVHQEVFAEDEQPLVDSAIEYDGRGRAIRTQTTRSSEAGTFHTETSTRYDNEGLVVGTCFAGALGACAGPVPSADAIRVLATGDGSTWSTLSTQASYSRPSQPRWTRYELDTDGRLTEEVAYTGATLRIFRNEDGQPVVEQQLTERLDEVACYVSTFSPFGLTISSGLASVDCTAPAESPARLNGTVSYVRYDGLWRTDAEFNATAGLNIHSLDAASRLVQTQWFSLPGRLVRQVALESMPVT